MGRGPRESLVGATSQQHGADDKAQSGRRLSEPPCSINSEGKEGEEEILTFPKFNQKTPEATRKYVLPPGVEWSSGRKVGSVLGE